MRPASTLPFCTAPYRVEVACAVGTPVAGVPSTPAPNEPKVVTLLPELVTAPERFAFVVTVAALPPMLKLAAVPVRPVPAPVKEVPVTVPLNVGLDANDVALPEEVTTPVRLALVVTVEALPVILALREEVDTA